MTNKPHIYIIIVAAGIGRRFQSEQAQSKQPKQYELIGDKTVLEHSIAAFDEVDAESITVVLHPEDCHWQSLQPIDSKHQVFNTQGGQQRHDSVRNGIKSLNADSNDWVLVHDAARPCVTAEEIKTLIEQCEAANQGGLLVKPIIDTVKFSMNAINVEKTIDRNELFGALTPQMFKVGDLLKALTVFEADSITDESSALEAQGHKPLMVLGKSSNMKITAFEDLALAEFILHQQGRLN